jgi:hypothetical protein
MFVEGGKALDPGHQLEDAPTEWIEEEIGTLAAHIAAATCRWLELIAEFDRRDGYETWGFHSCGAWVAWRCSIDPRSAREHVRVARALDDLPLVRERFRRGELSYSKVRAITRVANERIEEELVEMARLATAAQLERLVSGYRYAASCQSASDAHRDRFLSFEWEDGSLCIRARLTAEDGALFLKALAAGEDGSAQGGSAEPEPSMRVKRADALMELAEGYLGDAKGTRPAGERHQVVVHADAEALSGKVEAAGCRLEDGPAIAAETARRLACDASLISILHGKQGKLDIGRKTRAVPPAMRRALQVRDEGRCQFPGCENHRWVDAHHIRHWARGGETKLDNLVLLCGHHHRLVHEGGFKVLRRGDGRMMFWRPDGRPLPTFPFPTRGRCAELRARNRDEGLEIAPDTAAPLGAGESWSRDLAVVELMTRDERRRGSAGADPGAAA